MRGQVIDWGGGGQIAWGVSNSRLRTALHTMKLSPQNSFGESHSQRLVRRKALRELNALRALPVYPVFEDEKSNRLDEKLVKRRIA